MLRNIDRIQCPHILLAIDACKTEITKNQIVSQYQDPRWDRPGDDDEAKRQRFIQNTLNYKTRLFLTSGEKTRSRDTSQFSIQFRAALKTYGGVDKILEVSELHQEHLKKLQPKLEFGQFGGNETGSNFLFVLGTSGEEQLENQRQGQDESLQEFETWEAALIENTITAYENFMQLFPGSKYNRIATAKIKDLKLIQEEENNWANAQEKNTVESYKNFLDVFPKSQYVPLAKFREETLKWQEVDGSYQKVLYKEFLRAYPNGAYANLAKKKLRELSKMKKWEKRAFAEISEDFKKMKKEQASIDSDNDGISDSLDEEPNSHSRVKVDSRGRAIDSDRDGIPDGLDLEPDFPPEKGQEVDTNGIVIDTTGNARLFYENSLRKMYNSQLNSVENLLPVIIFLPNKFEIEDSQYEVLTTLGQIIKAHSNVRFAVEGFHDASQTETENSILAYKRSLAVIKHLTDNQGIDKEQLVLQYQKGISSFYFQRKNKKTVRFHILRFGQVDMSPPSGYQE